MKSHLEHINDLLSINKFPGSFDMKELPSSGSDRKYFRISFSDENTIPVLAAYNPNVSENIAWYSYTAFFRNKGFPVPEILAKDDSYQYFLLQDLGDTTLFSLLPDSSEQEKENYFFEAVRNLILFQTEGIVGLDLDVAYPIREFNARSILWDLNYFKYYFIKPNNILFDENNLEDDFTAFIAELLKADKKFFMYRDFQSRNIMLHESRLWFIDFQGGRKGPLQYDLVSLLYQARAGLTNDFRNRVIEYYLSELSKKLPGVADEFKKKLPYFIYFRLFQVLGAYGFRGMIERKSHFLKSIPYALVLLREQLQVFPISDKFPALASVLESIISTPFASPTIDMKGKLNIYIRSFSYLKSGYPTDFSEHGGGFIFDCRSLPNPGRIPELRNYSGLEKPVIDFFVNKPVIGDFLENVNNLVSKAAEEYLEKGFTYLSVGFGCTGGMHRSVYAAEQLKKHLSKYGSKINIVINHPEING